MRRAKRMRATPTRTATATATQSPPLLIRVQLRLGAEAHLGARRRAREMQLRLGLRLGEHRIPVGGARRHQSWSARGWNPPTAGLWTCPTAQTDVRRATRRGRRSSAALRGKRRGERGGWWPPAQGQQLVRREGRERRVEPSLFMFYFIVPSNLCIIYNI
jgi:hypothetical protein